MLSTLNEIQSKPYEVFHAMAVANDVVDHLVGVHLTSAKVTHEARFGGAIELLELGQVVETCNIAPDVEPLNEGDIKTLGKLISRRSSTSFIAE